MKDIRMREKAVCISKYEQKISKYVKNDVLKKFISQNEDMNILLEKLVFCQFADEHDFANYFRINELEESELFCLIGFLYHQDCFLMMLDIMNRHMERFISHNISLLKEIDISEQFIKRLESFMSVRVRTDNF